MAFFARPKFIRWGQGCQEFPDTRLSAYSVQDPDGEFENQLSKQAFLPVTEREPLLVARPNRIAYDSARMTETRFPEHRRRSQLHHARVALT